MAKDLQADFEDRAHVMRRDLRTYARILLKYAPLIIIIAVMSTLTAFLYSWYTTPVFEARAMIQIERETVEMMPSVDSIFYGDSRDLDFYQTQYKLLRSRSLIRTTLDKLAEKSSPFLPPGVNDVDGRISAFLRKVDVRPETRSQLVQVIVEDENKEHAMLYANTLAEMFIKQTVDRRMRNAEDYVKWLKDRLKEQEEDAKACEDEFHAFKEQHNIEDYAKQVAEKRTTIETLEDRLAQEKSRELTGTNLTEEAQLALERRISALQEDLDARKRQVSELEKLNAQYVMLERRVRTSQNLYQTILDQHAQYALLIKEFEPRNISIIDYAEIPQRPSKPRTTLNIMFGLLFGLALGAGISFFIEYLDDTIKSPNDIETFLRIPYLGLIPAGAKGSVPIEGIVEHEPKGTVAEQYRAIRTNILFSSNRATKSLLITSSGPAEGKTTTALNIAQAMARAGDRTVLVDADMRRPRLHKLLNITETARGLSSYLVGNHSLDEIIRETILPGLYFICAGPIPPNPVELLNSPRLADMLSQLTQRFDRVILDSPPVIAVTDAPIMSRLVDGVIMTVHGGRAHRDVVKRGVEAIRMVSGTILGVILNNVNIYRASYYDYYYYSYYREAYGDSGKKKTSRREKTAAKPPKEVAI